MREVWKAIPGYERFYEVSTLGQVRSVPRIVVYKNGRRHRRKGKNLKLTPRSGGYRGVNLSKKGKTRQWSVHQLVLLAFIGPCPPGKESCHEDGDPVNNCIDNLRYDTKKANHADKKRHGTHVIGSRHGCARLTEQNIVSIRNSYSKGRLSVKQIVKKYGVAPSTVNALLTRRTWRHVGGADCSDALSAHMISNVTLTARQVKEIRRLRKEENWTYKRLAKKFGTTSRNVGCIVRRESWKNV